MGNDGIIEWQKGLPRLPTELIDMILEHLPEESIIALALTCRALYMAHFPQATAAHIFGPARTNLLEWLERDFPQAYYCQHCNSLHPWSASCDIESGVARWTHPSKENGDDIFKVIFSTLGQGLLGIGCQHAAMFSAARLVMNRHFYGPTHGIDLEGLEGTEYRTEPGVEAKRSWMANIVRDELYIRVETVFQSTNETADDEALKKFILSEHVLVCCHVYARPDDENWDIYTIPGPGPIGREHEPFRVTYTGVESCIWCFTDYRIRIAPKRIREPASGWVVTITRWHNLGSFRSLQDPEWVNLVSPSVMDIQPSSLRISKCAWGTIRKQWMATSLPRRHVVQQPGNTKRPGVCSVPRFPLSSSASERSGCKQAVSAKEQIGTCT